ncbi:hypothetical protein M0R45_029746 [Rubus argutus]|uniref:Purple acid phosphatase n=1 Tax=Rubus argutus TaxID=59490 RepID=A0AAW1WD72_RUBAR
MKKLSLHLFSFLVIISLFPHLLKSQDDDFVRQPAGRVILTPHDRSDSDPQQVHISLVGKDHMKVSWVTDNKHTKSIVEYGKNSGKYNAKATGEHTSYDYFSYTSGRIHHVTIGPLEPSTTYFYRCGSSGPEFSFKTPPQTLPIEFVVVGDLGQTDWTNSTLAHIQSIDYDVLLLPGDLSYADGHQPLWDSFGRIVEPLSSHRPWMVTEGNHEVEFSPVVSPTRFTAFNARWQMPYKESKSTSNLYYSFQVAGTHIIILGSYTEFDTDSEQYAWLVADLAKIDRKRTPWVVVVLHAPWYNTNTAHQGEGESMRIAMEELLYKARVDLVYSGHVHAYERFTRVYNNKADPCGPVHVTIGDGGNREGLALVFKDPASPLSLYREPSFGHGRFRIVNETHAVWGWHRNNDSNFVVKDQVWLQSLSSSKTCYKSGNPQFPSSSKDEL